MFFLALLLVSCTAALQASSETKAQAQQKATPKALVYIARKNVRSDYLYPYISNHDTRLHEDEALFLPRDTRLYFVTGVSSLTKTELKDVLANVTDQQCVIIVLRNQLDERSFCSEFKVDVQTEELSKITDQKLLQAIRRAQYQEFQNKIRENIASLIQATARGLVLSDQQHDQTISRLTQASAAIQETVAKALTAMAKNEQQS